MTSKPSLLALLLLPIAGAVHAQQADLESRLAACAKIENDIARLECFDGLAARLGGQASGALDSPGRSEVGKWTVTEDTNPLDDSRTVTLALRADEGKTSTGDPVQLVLRCQSEQTAAYIIWNDYFGDDDRSVAVRIGSGPVDRQRWGLSTDHTATFYPGTATAFIMSLGEADRLVAQATPSGKSPVTAIFDVRGILEASRPLREACGW